MKKLGIAVLGALSLTLLSAITALAQEGGSAIPPGEHEVLPDVILNAPGGVAFTGSEITVWMILAVALLVVGVAFLIAARRRAKTPGNS